MELGTYFPFWNKLSPSQQKMLTDASAERFVKKGTLLHNGNDCLGLIVVKSGQLRNYIVSDEGREITIYRLFERDICLFSASCIMRSLMFDITVEAEKDSVIWVIKPDVFRSLMDESLPVSNYINEIMATRFSEVMWLMEQIMWKSFDKRLAEFLVEECNIEGSSVLKITHEKIANHLGTAREVVTRMLKYFQTEGMVSLTRGAVEVTDVDRLKKI